MGDRVSKDEIQKASSVHIIDYLESKGENLIKQGKYYRHSEHDSLVINENGKWFWNSRNEGGFGSISFARSFYDYSFQDAVRDVNGQEITKTIDRENTITNKPFDYPKQYEKETQNNITDYLHNKRRISKTTINNLIKSDLIAEDKKNNCVFKWKDRETGEVIGADRQGTIEMYDGNYFKQIVSGSKADGGFQFDVGEPENLILFESPIDAISYYDLYKPSNTRFKSMSGLKDRSAATSVKELAKEIHDNGRNFQKIIIAVDNDDAGHNFSNKWVNMFNISERHTPKSKDWNQDLTNYRKQELERVKIHNAIEMER